MGNPTRPSQGPSRFELMLAEELDLDLERVVAGTLRVADTTTGRIRWEGAAFVGLDRLQVLFARDAEAVEMEAAAGLAAELISQGWRPPAPESDLISVAARARMMTARGRTDG